MEDVEYLNMAGFLQSISALIAKRDWEAFMLFIDDLKCLNPDTGHYETVSECIDLQRINDIAGHMKAVKDIVLECVVTVSHQTETQH